jgi:hypothetical protein
MSRKAVHSSYAAIEKKSFRSVLKQFLLMEFPHLGGPMIVDLFVDKVQRLIDEYHPLSSRLKMGQILWFAVAKDDKPTYGKTMEKTRIVPVVLTLVNHEDIAKIRDGAPLKEVKKAIKARLYREADRQNGTLSEADVSLLTMSSRNTVGRHTQEYEQEHNAVLPRRGTVHDMGNSISHKATICRKRKIERKATSVVARETNHSPGAVDRYTLNLDRVAFCLQKNLSVDDASFVTGLSRRLVLEYQGLAQEVKEASASGVGFLDEVEDEILF